MSPQKIVEQLNEIKMMITKGSQFQKEIFTIKDALAYPDSHLVFEQVIIVFVCFLYLRI